MYRIKTAKFLLFIVACFYTLPALFYSNQVNWVFVIYIYLVILVFFTFLVFYKPRESSKDKFSFDKNNNSNFTFCVVGILLLYLFILSNTINNFTEFFNRSTRNSDFLQGNTYVIVDIFTKVLFICIMPYLKSNKKNLVGALILFSIIFDFAYLGARRTSTFVILVVVWNMLENISRSKFVYLGLLLIVFGISGFLFSGYRELIYSGIQVNSLEEVILASVFTNEFQVVSLNMLEYMQYATSNGFMPYEILFSSISVFIPRFFWNSKPLTIDKQLEIFPNIFGELYLNFGFFSIFFLLVIVYLVIKEMNRNSIIGLVLFASIPDMFRITIDQFLLVMIIYILSFKFINLKLKS